MRLHWRTDLLSDTALVRDVALVCLADGIVGVSFGATAVAGGLPWWVPVVMSLIVVTIIFITTSANGLRPSITRPILAS